MPLKTYIEQRSPRIFSPKTARTLAVSIAVSVAILDWVIPAVYNVSIFYGLAIALCAWSGSRKFLWSITAAIAACLYLVLLILLIAGHPVSRELVPMLVTKSFRTLSLFLIAGLVQRWMNELVSSETERGVAKRLLQALDQAQVVIRKVDGTILFWSQGAERLYGWTAEEAIGKQTHRLLQTDFGSDSLERINEQLEGDDSFWAGELCHVRKDGSPVWVASQWTRQDHGLYQFPVVTEVNNDVSKLKAAETRFRNLTQVIPHLIWHVSPSGQTTYANQRWHDYFGRIPEEIIATPTTISEFVHPDDASKSVARWKTAFQRGIMEPWEVRYRRHDGVYRWFSGRAVALRDNRGQVLYWIGTATDIDDEKNIQERLRETQKIESIGRLAAGVAHDFNNLLTAVSGYNSLLYQEIAETNVVASGYIREVQKATDRAAGLTRQLLTFSRPQVGKPQLVNLNSAVTDISKILNRVMGEDIRLVVDLLPDVPNVLADPVQVDQIVMNLALNARDAMPNGGTIRIETGAAEIGEVEAKTYQVSPGTYVSLLVQDNGTGIDKKTKARLFEPFFSTKEQGKGTGLGLSIVSGIVKHSGGFIKVDSFLGKGTEFTILLPVSTTESESANQPDETQPSKSFGGETILVVEDEEVIRHIVGKSLRKQGYT